MSRLERWSRRKLAEGTETAEDSQIDAATEDSRDIESSDVGDAARLAGDADDLADVDHPANRADEPPTPGSLDATLPDPESLAPGSDIKAFLEPGVSRGLRRRALRRLFAGEKYGIRDGLDDYDHDYREKLKPLASELAQRMRKWTTPAEETPQEIAEQEMPVEEGNPGETVSSPPHHERPAAQEAATSSDDSEDSTEGNPSNDDPTLDQGRVGNSHQSGQD